MAFFGRGRTKPHPTITELDGESPLDIARDVPRLENVEVTTDKIRKSLKNLKRNKALGPDGIQPRIIKLIDEVLQPLKILYTNSLEEVAVPGDWKVANITEIFKMGSKCDRGNYRPVSLTSVL